MVAIRGSHSGVSHCSSKTILKLPRSRICHRIEDGKYPQVLISKPKKDLSPRWDEGEVAALAQDKLDYVEPLPSLVTNMAQNWKDIEAAKATQQSSANFRSRIEHTSRPFKNWDIEASKEQKTKRGRLTEVSLPGMRVCALSGVLAVSKVVNDLVEEEFGGHMLGKEGGEGDKHLADEEDLNITVGLEEERLRGAAKVQSWLEGL